MERAYVCVVQKRGEPVAGKFGRGDRVLSHVTCTLRGIWRKPWRKWIGWVLLSSLIAAVLVLEFFSRGAARIFNRAVAQQDMLRGTITVEKLLADLTGHVQFEQLIWKDPKGHTILQVPRGSFSVAPLDVIMGRMSSTTVQALTLHDAVISVHLDQDMKVDFIRPSPEIIRLGEYPAEDWEREVRLAGESEEARKALGEERRRQRRLSLERRLANFNRAGRRLHLALTLDKCRVEIFHQARHYLFHPVRVNAVLDTAGLTQIRATTGGFGGTMVGSGMGMHGNIDFRVPSVPICDLTVMLYEVDPSSLGFGMNLQDRMTLLSHFEGAVSRPVGRGVVKMNELHIPALHFTDVFGAIRYEDGELQFDDVSADVYGGRLLARGMYHLDTRYYRIDGQGTGLLAAQALPGSGLTCAVDLDLHVESKGGPRQTTFHGSFRSGDGHYRWLPFRSITGNFYEAYHDLRFSALDIELASFHISTDALRVKDGKLTLQDIRVIDEDGRLLHLVEPPERQEEGEDVP